MQNIATLITDNLPHFRGHAAVYHCQPPLNGYNYVVVSAVHNADVHETYIFGSDNKGEILKWQELDGSYKAGVDHAQALAIAGYYLLTSFSS